MRREDKERQRKRIQRTIEFAAMLVPDCPVDKRVDLVRDLYPVVLQIERDVNLKMLEAMQNMKVRFVYRPRLPK